MVWGMVSALLSYAHTGHGEACESAKTSGSSRHEAGRTCSARAFADTPQTGVVRPPYGVKLAFPDVFDRVVPRSLVWVETGIRTSRPCVESRTRSVQILAEQRRIPWSDQYSIPEWEAIITSEKQRLVLVVRVGPPGRYEHIGFERMFLAWQLATVETDVRSFSTWIPPTSLNEEVLRRAADRHEDRTSWLIRPCTARTSR